MHWLSREPEVFGGDKGVCARWNARFAGEKAFLTKEINGYLVAMVLGKTLKAHRVIWALHYGKWPALYLDHIDGDRANNAISNLREATPSQNGCNRRSAKNSKSSYLGVSWVEWRKRWTATIRISGKRKTIGYFKTEIDAAMAYDAWAIEHHGEFARPNFAVA